MYFQALIASGEESLIERFSAALGNIGVNLESFSDTGGVLSLLSSRRFEAVLLDCDLEGGMGLVRGVREHPLNERALVLAFVTGNDAARSAHRFGANFVVPKPIDWALATRTLRAAKTMIIHERRLGIRERVRVPVKVRLKDSVLDSTILDLSDGGVAVRTPANIPCKSLVDLEFGLPGSVNSVTCAGIVVWSSGKLIGVEFSSMSPAAERTILRFLDCHSPRRAQRRANDVPVNRALDWGY